MNPSALFVRRPVMTTLVMAAILVFGIMAYFRLPVSDLPSVDFPTIEVSASLSGANPETMASSVATPLEKQFSTIAGLDSMTSVSSLGSTRITLQFDLNRNIDDAALDVQSAITTALRRLPDDMTSTPSFRKVNPADSPILYLALSSPTMRLSDVNEYAENFMAQRISMVNGVAQVMVYGSQKYAVRIQLSPERLASMELGVDEVAEAVRKGNVNLPVGTVAGPVREYIVRSNGKLMNAEDYKPLVVSWRDGAPVRLADVADVFDSVEQIRRRNWYNSQPGMILAIQRQPGTNTVEVVQAVRDLLPTFQEQLPAAVELNVLYDRSESIKESIEDVQFTLLLTVGLVILVIFLFLRRLSATIIPSLALPMSIVGTFAVMYLYGFSLNNISLMALTLSVGFVVDDAIVMLENIVRHGEMGKSTMEAVMVGSREIAFTIVSMTISLAAVFLPVLFMGGVVGRLFHEFAVTICASILISGLVSLTLTPMLCSLIIRPRNGERRHGRLFNLFERGFEGLRNVYAVTLGWTVRHRRLTLLASFLVLGLTVVLFKAIPKGFLPIEDAGRLMVSTESEQGVAFAIMMKRQQALMRIVAEDPAVDGYMSVVGGGGPNRGGNTGRLMVNLKPRSERGPIQAVQQRLRQKLSQVPGIRAFVSNPPAIRIGGRSSKGQYQYTLQSPNTEELFKVAAEMEKRMMELSSIQDVSSDMEFDNPELSIVIDRDKASALGVSAYQIEDALSTSFGNRKVSSIYAPTDTYDVIMELAPEYQANPQALAMLSVRSQNGKLVRLETLAKWGLGVGPLSINHSGQLPSATISFNLPPGQSLGSAMDSVARLAAEVVPPSVSTSFQGEAQAFQDSMRGLWVLLAMAILVIYLVLGVLYESFVHPLTILSGLPSAGVGALLTLMLFGQDLNIYGFVGIIMLIGIVKKNAIMMIDFAVEAQRVQGNTAAEAIQEGALIRFRPIMMTTMAALMGTLPIALGFGAGAEARRPLGLAVVGGLLVSQLLTLYFTPVYYMYLDRAQQKLNKIFGRAADHAEKA
ncbi:efflux RND transporter permease subunit [Pseudodesulfovibrio indicus]|uniref:Acriflavine resistance protein B n=1 Tax=Pseudodesulfovibrio indicus TaxID=1716143 RepID=A0A126QN53_9BACT|nr:efflux RND transporter permease subunit [Pseudodesulfovibrio indicus]AMK11206.1 acriflavine resistance protein B [Pseudodesulfovibrio indicus]TDT92232.1 HAE1 family hydrophobic/amphiphilic exporter-1 [Pseudodesulfovibrio indicus]